MKVKIIDNDQDKIDSYFKSKVELDAIRSDVTLMQWNILSKANKLGKEIWGRGFTMVRLSKDMGLPYTTTKRCLSLDKASKKSWALLKEKKISAFKLAMICQLKNNGFQDEIVSAVIKDNLSTFQIKSFKPKNIQDINKWRHKKAVERGYSREDIAFRGFNVWIHRGTIFMLLPISKVGVKHKKEILGNLKKLHTKIGNYLKKNEALL